VGQNKRMELKERLNMIEGKEDFKMLVLEFQIE